MPTLVSNRGRLDFSTTGEDDSEDGEDSDGWTASGWSSRPASVSESLRGMHRRSKSFTSDTGGTGSGTESLTDSASSLGSEDDDDEDGDYDEDGTVSSSASMLGGGGGGGGSSDRTGSLLLPWSRHHHRHRLQKPLRISSLGPGSASAAAVVVALPQQQLHQEPFPLQYSQQQQQQQQHQHHRSSRPPRRHHTFSGVASFVGSGGSGSGSARVGELGYLPLHPLSHLGIPGQTRSRTRGGGGLIPQQLVDSEDNDNRSRDHRRVGSSGVGPTPTIQRRSRPSTSGQGVSLQLSPPPLPSPPPLLSPGAAALAPTSSYGPLPLVASPTSASMPPTSARLSPSETTPTLPQPPVSPQLAVEEVPPIDTVPGFPALPMRLTRAVDLSALSAEGPLDVPVSLPSLTPAIRQGGAKPSGPPLATLPHRALARQWLLTRMDVSTRSPRGQLVLELVAGHLYVGAVPPASVTRDHSDGADPVASGDEGLVEVHLEWRGHVPRAWALDLAAAHALILPGPSSRGMTSATTPLSRSGQGPSLASHRGGGGVVLAPGSASGLAAAAGTLDQARRTLPASALPPPPPLAVLLITELEVLVVVPSTRHLKRRFIGDWRWAGGAAGGGGAGSGPIVFGAHGALFGTMAARSDLEDMVDTVTEAHDSAVDRPASPPCTPSSPTCSNRS
ncbi:hypothetical protein BC828DRAFT_400278 [Blastocladiella britannica]|nr:hypothetical protein BC828DRAFT_400278 [Blastocladiella britannica]